MDTIRQASGVAIACIYLFTVAHPTLLVASMLYCAPYLVMIVITGVRGVGPPPQVPRAAEDRRGAGRRDRRHGLYLQGDVLLLGWITNKEIVGYYALAMTVTTALATIGQSYSGTFVQALREKNGDLSAGPPLRTTLIIAAVMSGLVFLTGVVLLLSPAPTQVALAMLIMSGYCGVPHHHHGVPDHPVRPAARHHAAACQRGAGTGEVRAGGVAAPAYSTGAHRVRRSRPP